MLTQIERLISREEAFLQRFAPGASQHSLLKNRIAALCTVRDLITGRRTPSREELEFALPRIESIIRKTSKARDKSTPDCKIYKQLAPLVNLMEAAKALILQSLENKHEPLCQSQLLRCLCANAPQPAGSFRRRRMAAA